MTNKNDAMFSAQREISEKGPFFKTDMTQYAIQLGFDKGVKWKQQQMIDKAWDWILIYFVYDTRWNSKKRWKRGLEKQWMNKLWKQ